MLVPERGDSMIKMGFSHVVKSITNRSAMVAAMANAGLTRPQDKKRTHPMPANG
jgi:hypothetical protein